MTRLTLRSTGARLYAVLFFQLFWPRPVSSTLEGMDYSLSKIDAAVDQIDWSIRLFLDHRAYVPAITLAGAAEEILGAVLGDQSVFALVKKKLSTELDFPEKIISQAHMNRARNWLKHWNETKDEETITIDLEGEAIQYIVRALANLILHDRSLPSEGPRFFNWLYANRKDLHAF